MKQENVDDCKSFPELSERLNPSKLTHPKHIWQKAKPENIQLNKSESMVFEAMQGMFNAKPDLVITIH